MNNSADQGGCCEVCIILHIHSQIFPFLKGVSPFRSSFFRSPKITQSRRQVFSVNGSIIYRGLHFRRHWFNNLQRAALLTSLVQYDREVITIWPENPEILVCSQTVRKLWSTFRGTPLFPFGRKTELKTITGNPVENGKRHFVRYVY